MKVFGTRSLLQLRTDIMFQLGVLVDLSEDTKHSQVSSVLSPVSDEMPVCIKFLSTLKKYNAANSEDELIPCTRKYFPYCSTGDNQLISALYSRLREMFLKPFYIIIFC